jgi:succinate dehydrogenase/fumarate reductase flavoprotein subunit
MAEDHAAQETFDVVIVGGGGAGLAAAIEARTQGRRVVLLEKNPRLGGSSALSIGSISASATPHQLRDGIQDSPEDHWADMALFAGELAPRDNDELRRILCEAMPDTFRWLLSLGVRFYGPMPEPPHRKPRMHTVLPNAQAYIHHLERHARRIGVDIRTVTRAVRLIADEGRVRGVGCEEGGAGRNFMGRGGVVLAAGDFTASAPLKDQYLGAEAAAVEAVNPTATGDGQTLALALGARIVNGDLALGPEIRFVAPARRTLATRLPPWRALAAFMEWSMDNLPQALLRPFVMSFLTTALAPSTTLFENGAVLVNAGGARFCDETERPAFAIPGQPGKLAYIVLDGVLAEKFSAWPHFVSTAPGVAYAYIPDYRRNRRDVYHQAPSLAELAAKLGMDGGALGQVPLARPPFIALGPVRSVFVHNEGGLAVDVRHRVLGLGDAPIAGLYAAGSTGQGGLLLKGHGHHLAWAFASGRRAGRHAAFDVTSEDLAG